VATKTNKDAVSAERFWMLLCGVAAKRSQRLVGRNGAWTRAMYELLHEVQDQLGLWCACEKPGKGHLGVKGEHLEIDLMWFTNDGDQYGLPLVAIEHENKWNMAEVKKDLWRVCMVCAPLRVFFGYAPNEKALQDRCMELVGLTKRCRRLPGGEDLVILRHQYMPLGKFVAWRVIDTGAQQLAESAPESVRQNPLR